MRMSLWGIRRGRGVRRSDFMRGGFFCFYKIFTQSIVGGGGGKAEKHISDTKLHSELSEGVLRYCKAYTELAKNGYDEERIT